MKDLRLSSDSYDRNILRYAMIVSSVGFLLSSKSKILDFGCGAGGLVYAFRDRGFDAHGFDIHNFLQLRNESDKSYFKILIDQPENMTNFKLDWDTFRLPYPNDYFDFVFSSEVFEHVQNHDCILKELSRVMKPKSVAVHTFPSRWRLIEPHINIPLGGIIKSYPYYLFWTTLGIRNQYFKDQSAKVTAQEYYIYASNGLNYVPVKKLKRIGKKYFTTQHFSPDRWKMPYGINKYRFAPRPLRRWLFTRMKHVCWVLCKDTSENVIWND